jgi:CRISPR-associated protein Cas1
MKQHLNTLFVQTDGAWLKKDGQTIAVVVEGEVRMRVPVHTIGGVACFGRINATTPLLSLCAENDVAVSFLNQYGRLQARVTGFTKGNVLLRRDQYRAADDEARSCSVAGPMVAAKIANSRTTLLRGVRDHGDPDGAIAAASSRMVSNAEASLRSDSLDKIRGNEGEAANSYFGVLDRLVTLPAPDREAFRFTARSRRPPRDRFNCLLSFLYAMLAHDARSACESCGLDPAVGFLHRDRPGRPSLALDLMEELRSFLCDRLVLSLVNRRQIQASDFDVMDGGAVLLSDSARRTVLAAYQKRKQEEILHPYLGERVTVGLLVHLHARLLSRVLRGELEVYPAFIWK